MTGRVLCVVEGHGVWRVPAAEADYWLQEWQSDQQPERIPDVYVVDSQGRTWAPCMDCWTLWD